MTDAGAIVEAIRSGDRRVLARAITRVEDDHADSPGLLAASFAVSHRAQRLGITGAPGAGKSTLTSALIGEIRSGDETVAVLAVDPSSPFTGGSILGDRIRMQEHIDDPSVYVRSLSSRGHLGGLSAAVPKAATILDAAGFDHVIIETVGVGQAEVEIMGHADATVVVVTPGWGDSVQANKAGLLEIGDVFVVNKADRTGAADAVRDLTHMLELGREASGADEARWQPPVLSTVATDANGTPELWKAVGDLMVELGPEGLKERRRARLEATVRGAVQDSVLRRLETDDAHGSVLEAVLAGEVDPWSAARRILDFGW